MDRLTASNVWGLNADRSMIELGLGRRMEDGVGTVRDVGEMLTGTEAGTIHPIQGHHARRKELLDERDELIKNGKDIKRHSALVDKQHVMKKRKGGQGNIFYAYCPCCPFSGDQRKVSNHVSECSAIWRSMDNPDLLWGNVFDPGKARDEAIGAGTVVVRTRPADLRDGVATAELYQPRREETLPPWPIPYERRMTVDWHIESGLPLHIVEKHCYQLAHPGQAKSRGPHRIKRATGCCRQSRSAR
jgi:hypothetical protein